MRRLGTNDIRAFAGLAGRILAADGGKVDPESQGYTTLLHLLKARMRSRFPSPQIFATAIVVLS